MSINWKTMIIVALDVTLVAYLFLALTRFNAPGGKNIKCEKVTIDIQDQNSNGFINAKEIKQRLIKKKLYPIQKTYTDISLRNIEETITSTPFVKNVQAAKHNDGEVTIKITQLMPVVRIKTQNGDDYYIDDKNNVMPQTQYIADIIIATGQFNRAYATKYITELVKQIQQDTFWKNQIVQINITPTGGIEIIPRVGEQIILLGYIPQEKDKNKRIRKIKEFVENKLSRLKKFYIYGLAQVGWNKYKYIDMQFDNQIICKKNIQTQ